MESIDLDCSHRRIRIAFAIDNLSRAGTESQLLALIRTLDRDRFEPSLILLDGENADSRELEPIDCPMVRLGVRKLFSRSALRAAKQLRQLWRTNRPDVLQSYFLDASYFTAPIAKWCGVPTVIRVRNNLGYWLTRKHRGLNRLIRPFVDFSLTNSDAGRETLIAHDRLAPSRVAMIENGVDLERFEPALPAFSGTIRVGCVANLRPVKNIDGLMRIANVLLPRFPNMVFEVAGDGEDRPQLEQLHRTLNLGERFRLRGSVRDVPAFLQSLDVAVLPSHSEGMSNALLEYMAAGRAIVATNVGANARLITDREEGRIVPAGDDAKMAEAIAELLANPESARRMAAAARTRVAKEYSRDAMRRRFENFYEQCVSRTDIKRTVELRVPDPGVS
jgi:L-malate glycosyltransferase